MRATLDQASRERYTIRGDRATHEEIRTGCLQRMAAATETMARDREALVRRVESAEASAEFWKGVAERRGRTITALQGWVTRYRRRLGLP